MTEPDTSQPEPAPWVLPPPRPRWSWRSVGAAVVVAVVVAGSGALLGWLWTVVAPRLAVVKSDPCCLYAETEPEQPIAADGWFAILGAGAGVFFAVLAWVLLRRYRGVSVLAGLVVGSLVGSVIAAWVGYRIGDAQFHRVLDAAADGDVIDGPLRLAITAIDPHLIIALDWHVVGKIVPTGVAAVQALAASFVYVFLAGFSTHPDLRGDADQFTPGRAGSSPNDAGTALS